MKITIEMNEVALRDLVVNKLKSMLGTVELDEKKLRIEVKSKQNYKSEWEEAAFRAVYESHD